MLLAVLLAVQLLAVAVLVRAPPAALLVSFIAASPAGSLRRLRATFDDAPDGDAAGPSLVPAGVDTAGPSLANVAIFWGAGAVVPPFAAFVHSCRSDNPLPTSKPGQAPQAHLW